LTGFDDLLFFHKKSYPLDMGETEIESLLTHLAVNRNVATSAQNQALSALLFFYWEVLERDRPWLDNVTRAKNRVVYCWC
jgi:hypothetical protein